MNCNYHSPINSCGTTCSACTASLSAEGGRGSRPVALVARELHAYLMRKGRTCPDLDASLFFDPDEIRGAHLPTKKKLPAEPPTLNDVVRLIAKVGGFLGRKGDGEPGAKTIWRGLDQVHAAAETLRALRDGLG
jgi:hypothetical protein